MQDLWETPFLYPCRQLLYLSYFSPWGGCDVPGCPLTPNPHPTPLEYPRVLISKLPPLWPASHSPWLDKGIWLNIITKPPAPPHTPYILYIQKGIIYIGISRGPFRYPLFFIPQQIPPWVLTSVSDPYVVYCTTREACNKGLQFYILISRSVGSITLFCKVFV
jgi:hypothetical protein